MTTYTDAEFRAAQRELLRGLSTTERARRKHWMGVLRLAGIDIYRTPRGIGPNEMRLAAAIKAEHPAEYELLAEAHRMGTVDFIRRLPGGGGRRYLEQLVEQDPELYGPLVAA